jgi:hypothetical protein
MKVLRFVLPGLVDALRGLESHQSLNDHGPDRELHDDELRIEPLATIERPPFEEWLAGSRDQWLKSQVAQRVGLKGHGDGPGAESPMAETETLSDEMRQYLTDPRDPRD